MLAHRGIWDHVNEQNSSKALKRATDHGFGVETDIYELLQGTCVMHDCASGIQSSLSDLVKLISSSPQSKFALNVKSDGISRVSLESLSSENSFFFDMSSPEKARFLMMGLQVAWRVSELDPNVGGDSENSADRERYWVDGLYSHWWTPTDLEQIARLDTEIYIVSDELHRRDPRTTWGAARELYRKGMNVYLCTDFPNQALKEVFS